jgi:ubiquinone/menaquinone biosynthesis C-methylase UbiE
LGFARRNGAFQDGSFVLDVGCGNGFFTYHLPAEIHAVALDRSSTMLGMNPCPRLVQGSALSLPFPEDAFDTVFCSNLLHHLPDPKAAVAEMKRVSSRYVVLSEPNRNNPAMLLFGMIKRAERGTLKFTTRYLSSLANGVGLQVAACGAMGMVFPNRTSEGLLPLLRWVDGLHPWGAYVLLVAEKVRPS